MLSAPAGRLGTGTLNPGNPTPNTLSWAAGGGRAQVEAGAGHHEGAWQWRLTDALRYLLSPWWEHYM